MIHYITTNGVGNAWVGNELQEIKKAGVNITLHVMRKPEKNFFISPEIKQMNSDSKEIYTIPVLKFLLSGVMAPFLFRRHFFSALMNALFGSRESFLIRLKCFWHFWVACHWSRCNRDAEIDLIHSQWVHSCGTIAMYSAWLLDVPFSFTGHAADLFRERAALLDKIKRAEFINCISYFHRDFYLIHGAKPSQLKIVYCGINTSHFTPKQIEHQNNKKFNIISSGRLVEKKGFEYLIAACKLLVGKFDFQCTIAGSGELEERLNELVNELDLSGIVHITGEPLFQEKIPEFMYSGDCYCLPCVWASDNDVDGLPQMLMEAMACGLPVISTRLVGIPDLIENDRSGLLVEPNDSIAIAEAITYMYKNRDASERYAKLGRQVVLNKFNLDTCLEPLINEFNIRINN